LNLYDAKRSVATIIIAIILMTAQFASAQKAVIPIWPGVAPGSESWTQTEVEYLNGGKQKMVRNVVKPTLAVYVPEKSKATRTAVIVCPGGGFHFLSWQSEGTAVAEWLKERGVAAFVLKYRLIDTGATEEEYQRRTARLLRGAASGVVYSEKEEQERQAIPALAIADGRQAVKIVRQRAAEWDIAPDRIVLLGFSAGGAVTMGVVMQNDAESRPNYAAPIYGGGTGGAPVPADAPPLVILVANDDQGAAVGSAKLYSEWKAADKPAELHIYSKGGHGFGMNKRGLPVDSWIERFGEWLSVQGLLKPPK